MYQLKHYDYKLPENLIAQQPAAQREQSRLLVLHRRSGKLRHRFFSDLCDFLCPTDTLVVNNTEVIPGRLYGKKESGGRVELLILNFAENSGKLDQSGSISYDCLIRASKPPKIDSVIHFDQDLTARVTEVKTDRFTVRFSAQSDFEKILYRIGQVPLPPYIKRRRSNDESIDDRASYQTVYASQKGAIAAPTAGLHFSKDFLAKIQSRGIQTVEITLHVGYGTFLPVRVTDIRKHQIHSESYMIPNEAAETINQAKKNGGRIIAVGTTSVRTLEFATDRQGRIYPGCGACDLFIYPGYCFKTVDAMITNFHLPQSTLLMLVSAFAGRQMILDAYAEAIEKEYRFYSYGDAMLIE